MIDRRAFYVILALCDMEIQEFATHVGYEPAYVSNVLCGSASPSPAFARAFGDTIARLVLGQEGGGGGQAIPTGPLLELVHRQARSAPSRRAFYSDHGINMSYLNSHEYISEFLADRICTSLGVHPTALFAQRGA